MPVIPNVEAMLQAGVHFGHRSSRWHPKMRPFLFGVRSGVHVIDVEQTRTALERMSALLTDIAAKGGIVLFVATKPQAQAVVAQAASRVGMPSVTARWLGGTLTNWQQIQRLIRHYLDLKDKREKGELRKYTKLEQLNFDREIAELEEKIGGISGMTRIPDIMVMLDPRTDKTALCEARTMRVPVVALVDSNVNPVGVTHVIPGNDDAVGSIKLVVNVLADAVAEGRAKAAVAMAAAAAPVVPVVPLGESAEV